MPYVPKLPRYFPEEFTVVGGFSTGAKIDMRDLVPKVLNQGVEGSCVGNAIAASLNLLANVYNEDSTWSALGIHQDTLIFENRVGKQGVTPYNAFEVLKTVGVGSEETQPYNLDNLNHPQTQAYKDSRKTVTGLHEIKLDEDDFTIPVNHVRAALAEGRPVLVSFIAKQWFVNMYSLNDIRTQETELFRQGLYDQTVIGGHEILIVGYDPSIGGGSFIFQNSWGTGWGDQGFGALPVIWFRDWYTAVVLDGFDSKDMTYSPMELEIVSLYAAALGRPADMGGMDYWAGQVANSSLEQVSETMYRMGSPTASADTNRQAMFKFYVNVLGREPDTVGLDYWTAKLDAGESRGRMVVQLIDAVLGYSGDDPAAIKSQALFKNKVAVSAYNAVMLRNDNVQSSSSSLAVVTDNPNSVEDAKELITDNLGITK